MINKKSKSFDCKLRRYSFILLFALPATLTIGCFWSSNYASYVNSVIKPKLIRGIVLGKDKEETGCYGLIIIKQEEQVDTLRQIYYCTPPENAIWRYLEPGDSVLKEVGKLEVFVKRREVVRKFVFTTRIPL